MRAPLIAIAATAIPLVGCGSAAKVVHHRTVTIKLTEYRLTPQSITARKGRVTLVVVNTGRRTHNLVVSQDGTDIAATKALWPGQHAELTVSLPAGAYRIASTVLNDDSLGEYGTLNVS